jgi:hypothetical protein
MRERLSEYSSRVEETFVEAVTKPSIVLVAVCLPLWRGMNVEAKEYRLLRKEVAEEAGRKRRETERATVGPASRIICDFFLDKAMK